MAHRVPLVDHRAAALGVGLGENVFTYDPGDVPRVARDVLQLDLVGGPAHPVLRVLAPVPVNHRLTAPAALPLRSQVVVGPLESQGVGASRGVVHGSAARSVNDLLVDVASSHPKEVVFFGYMACVARQVLFLEDEGFFCGRLHFFIYYFMST